MGKSAEGRSHWFGDHPPPLRRGSNYARWIAEFDQLASDLKSEGVEVINASRATALTCFPRAPIEVALRGEAKNE